MVRSVLRLDSDRSASIAALPRDVTASIALCNTGIARNIDRAAADLATVVSTTEFGLGCAAAATGTASTETIHRTRIVSSGRVVTLECAEHARVFAASFATRAGFIARLAIDHRAFPSSSMKCAKVAQSRVSESNNRLRLGLTLFSATPLWPMY